MFCGPNFIISTMQAGITPVFKVVGMTGPSTNWESNPQNLLGQCWVPPIVAFYDQQGLLRAYSLPGSSIRSPHPGSPRGHYNRRYTSQWPYIPPYFGPCPICPIFFSKFALDMGRRQNSHIQTTYKPQKVLCEVTYLSLIQHM